jgi:hypothetical protein
MTSSQHHALLCLERLRALIEHANLPDVEMKRLDAEINQLLERHMARPQEAA